MKPQISVIMLISFMLGHSVGCTLLQSSMFRAPIPAQPATFSALRFEKTLDIQEEVTEQEKLLITVRFSNCTFRDGMRQLTEMTGVPISWDKSLDNEMLDGTFVEQPLNDVLGIISRRFNVVVTSHQGMYFLGTVRDGDMVSAVIRLPPVPRSELERALSVMGSGKTTIIGSFIWVTDTFANVQKLVADIETIRERSERSYLAEVFFIRVNEDDFIRLTADLRINHVDIFSSAFNINQLFSMFVDVDGKLGSVVIDTRPILLLSEGREASFSVGNEITRERRSSWEGGASSTTGFDTFQDGIVLTLLLHRVSDNRYSLDMELEVSTFDRADMVSYVPNKSTSILKSQGMLLQDGGVVYAGSLQRQDASRAFGIISLDGGRGSEVLTIWVRCREIR